MFEAASEGIVIFDPNYALIAVNQAFSRVTGYQIEDLLGRNVVELPCSRDARRHYSAIHQALEQHGSWQGELVEARKNGELYPQWLQLSVVRDARGNISHIVGFFADLSARRESEERMRYLTHYDELTGLANRSLFRERLHEAHQRVRQGGRSLALLHINLDRFKLLNDSLGHEVADQLLRRSLGAWSMRCPRRTRLRGCPVMSLRCCSTLTQLVEPGAGRHSIVDETAACR